MHFFIFTITALNIQLNLFYFSPFLKPNPNKNKNKQTKIKMCPEDDSV